MERFFVEQSMGEFVAQIGAESIAEQCPELKGEIPAENLLGFWQIHQGTHPVFVFNPILVEIRCLGPCWFEVYANQVLDLRQQ